MIQIATAVEDHVCDSLGHRPLRDRLADSLGSLNVAARGASQLLLDSRGRNQGLGTLVVYDLHVDVVQAAIDCQTWTRGCPPDLPADPLMDSGPHHCSA